MCDLVHVCNDVLLLLSLHAPPRPSPALCFGVFLWFLPSVCMLPSCVSLCVSVHHHGHSSKMLRCSLHSRGRIAVSEFHESHSDLLQFVATYDHDAPRFEHCSFLRNQTHVDLRFFSVFLCAQCWEVHAEVPTRDGPRSPAQHHLQATVSRVGSLAQRGLRRMDCRGRRLRAVSLPNWNAAIIL
jgi:hypothetical protein